MRDLKELAGVIKSTVPIREVTGNMAHRVLCGFHGSESTDLQINHGDNTFFCYSSTCPAHHGGDIIDWVCLTEHCTFSDAIKKLCEDFGISMGAPKKRIDILWRATLYFHDRLFSPAGERALAFLKGRGFSDTIIRVLKIGLCDRLPDTVSVAEAKFVGLVRTSERGTDYLGLNDLIVFPVFNKYGDPVHMQGRIYLVGDTRDKYKALPAKCEGESFTYNLNDEVYNEKSVYNPSGEVYMFEGIPDCIVALQWSLHAIAIFGNLNLHKQAHRLKDVRVLNVCMDSDEKTRKIILTELSKLQMKLPGLVINDIELPGVKDLNEFLLQGGTREDFLAVAEMSKMSFIARMIEEWGPSRAMHRDLIQTVGALPNSQDYVPLLAQALKRSEDAITFGFSLVSTTRKRHE